MARLGSSSPNRVASEMIATINTTPANTTITMPMANGTPIVWK